MRQAIKALVFRRAVVAMMVAFAAIPGLATAAGPKLQVDVVKIMSFSCSFCLSAEGGDRSTELLVRATGGRFIRAPVPSIAEETGARERLYYSARDINPEFGERVKASMYRGAQEAQVPLLNFMQVYTWVTEDLVNDEPKFTELFKKAQDIKSAASLSRAIGLAISAGVSSLPTYILLVNGQIKGVVDTSTTSPNGASPWRTTLNSQIDLLSNTNANTLPTPP